MNLAFRVSIGFCVNAKSVSFVSYRNELKFSVFERGPWMPPEPVSMPTLSKTTCIVSFSSLPVVLSYTLRHFCLFCVW